MGRRSGKTRRSPCSLAWLSNKITYKYVRNMSIKEGDMVSIRQDFIDEYHKHEYNSKDIWEVKEVYNIGGGGYEKRRKSKRIK